MIHLALWTSIAAAQTSPTLATAVRAVAVPWSTPARLAGEDGREPACTPIVQDLAQLCLRRKVDDRWEIIHADELRAAGITLADVATALHDGAAAHIATVPARPIEGTGASWLLFDDVDWSAAPLLAPDALAKRLGVREVHVALPNVGVTLAWAGVDPALDLIMAVGAQEMTEKQSGPLAADVLRWDGKAWVPFARATRKIRKEDLPAR